MEQGAAMKIADPDYLRRVEAIRARRELLRMSQTEMARRVGMSASVIQMIETGKYKTRERGLLAMELALDAADRQCGDWWEIGVAPAGLRWSAASRRDPKVVVSYALDARHEHVFRKTRAKGGLTRVEKCDLRGTRARVRLAPAPAERMARRAGDIPELLTPQEAADLAHVSVGHLYVLWRRADWRPEGVMTGNRAYYRREEILRWIAEHRGSETPIAPRRRPTP